MKRGTIALYWLMLALGHFLVDMMGGIFGPLLPALMKQLGVGYAGANALLLFFSFGSNGGQIVFGEISDRSRLVQRLMFLAPVVACAPLFMGFIHSYAALCVLLVIGGAAVALYHPVGLHEVSTLPQLPQGTAVSVFLAVGLCGWSAGSLVSAALVQYLGFQWLWLPLLPALVAAAVLFWGQRLFLERRRQDAPVPGDAPPVRTEGYSFPWIWTAALFVAFTSSALVRYMPAYMEAKDGDGGIMPAAIAVLFFGICGAIGGLVFGTLSERYPRGYVCAAALVTSTVFMAIFFGTGGTYLWWFSLSGLGIGSAFPLLVAMSHEAKGPRTHRRDGLMVGGAWGIAAAMILPLGAAADAWGLRNVLPWVTLSPPLALIGAAALEFARRRAARL